MRRARPVSVFGIALAIVLAPTLAHTAGPIRVRVRTGPNAPAAAAGAAVSGGASVKPVAIGNLSLTGSAALGVKGGISPKAVASPSPIAAPAVRVPLPQMGTGERTAVSPSRIGTRSAGELRDAVSPSPIPSPPVRSPLPQRGRGHGTTLESLSETGKRIAGGDGRAAVDALYHERGGESDGADFTPALMRRDRSGLTPSDPADHHVRRRYEEHKSEFDLGDADLDEALALARMVRAAGLPVIPVAERVFYNAVDIDELPVFGVKLRVADPGSVEGRKQTLAAFLEAARGSAEPVDFKVTLFMSALTGVSAGKFITIYPRDPAAGLALAERLDAALARAGVKGTLPSEDFRFRESHAMTWRPGGFTRVKFTIVGPDGKSFDFEDDPADPGKALAAMRHLPGMAEWEKLAPPAPQPFKLEPRYVTFTSAGKGAYRATLDAAAARRLFDMAVRAKENQVAAMGRVTAELGAQADVLALNKGQSGAAPDFASFKRALEERLARRYTERLAKGLPHDPADDVADASRGRVNVDDFAQVQQVALRLAAGGEATRISYPRATPAETIAGLRRACPGCKLKENGNPEYPRIHVYVRDRETGLAHEWQIGTRGFHRFIEEHVIDVSGLPAPARAALVALDRQGLRDGKANFHLVEYKLFRMRLLPQEAGLARRFGVFELLADFDAAVRAANRDRRANLAPERLAPRAAEILRRLAAEAPEVFKLPFLEEAPAGPEPARAPDSAPAAELGIRWPAENMTIPGSGRDARRARQYAGGSGRVFRVASAAGPLALKASDQPSSRFSREAALLRHLTPLLARPEVAARLPKGFGVIRFAGHFLVDGALVDGGQPDSLLGRLLSLIGPRATPAQREVLAMPWVEGRSLPLFLEDRAAGKVADAEWARFMAVYPDFTRGVRLLAELGLNNMDIQPQNILYDAAAGKLIMTDLGIAEWVSGPQLEDALMRLPARLDKLGRVIAAADAPARMARPKPAQPAAAPAPTAPPEHPKLTLIRELFRARWLSMSEATNTPEDRLTLAHKEDLKLLAELSRELGLPEFTVLQGLRLILDTPMAADTKGRLKGASHAGYFPDSGEILFDVEDLDKTRSLHLLTVLLHEGIHKRKGGFGRGESNAHAGQLSLFGSLNRELAARGMNQDLTPAATHPQPRRDELQERIERADADFRKDRRLEHLRQSYEDEYLIKPDDRLLIALEERARWARIRDAARAQRDMLARGMEQAPGRLEMLLPDAEDQLHYLVMEAALLSPGKSERELLSGIAAAADREFGARTLDANKARRDLAELRQRNIRELRDATARPDGRPPGEAPW